jgi:shikimate dehydrogenase
MKRFCVIGWPIKHSRSPLIHNHWIGKYGLDGIYEKRPVDPNDIKDFVTSFQTSGLTGCNVTVPHKETVFKLLTYVDKNATRIGAVNTLYLSAGKLRGTNTDGEGFLAHLTQSYPSFQIKGADIVIYGAGGAAKAIISALLEHRPNRITVINRTASNVENLRRQFGSKIKHARDIHSSELFEKCDLLINSTSLGMQGQTPLNLDLQHLNPKAIVADIVYSPLETDLLRQSYLKGNPTLGGLGMLLHQAVRGFELWFGVKPEVTQELHDLVVADLMKDHL